MELWIRSQNKEILRINPELEIYEYGKDTFLVIDTKGNIIYDKAKILGEYETKERALEVLDDIQNALKGNVENHINKFDLYRDSSLIVYQMPKE